MVSLPKSSSISKIMVAAAVVAFVPFAVGGLVSQWLTAEFTFPAIPPISNYSMDVDSHMGLMESCAVRKVMGNVISDECSSEGARDWQKQAAGVAVVSAAASVVALVLVVLNVTVRKVAGRRGVKLAIAGLSLVAAVMMTVAMILYGLNKKIQIRPPVPFEVEYDIGWAFVVAGVGSGFFLILMVLALVDSCSSSQANYAEQETRKQGL